MALIAWNSHYLTDQGYVAGQQTRVEACILAAQAAMEKYCKRKFESAEYSKVFKVRNTGKVFLNAFPVDWVGRVLTDQQTALTITSTDTNPAVATSDAALKLVYFNGSGVRQTGNLTYASNVTVSALATAISAVSGFTATAVSTFGSYASLDLVSGHNYTPSANVLIWNEKAGSHYGCDLSTGVLHLDGLTNTLVRVTWTGGFSDIPEDLERVCAELTKNVFNEIKGNIVSENLGPYQYTLSNSTNRLPLSVRKTLELYKDRRV